VTVWPAWLCWMGQCQHNQREHQRRKLRHHLIRPRTAGRGTYDSVVALMDHPRCDDVQRLELESTSEYWRIWYYLAEAAGLQVWLVNAKDTKYLPGRTKSDREGCVWLCKLNERGTLRRSFVPPEPVRDLRSLTRTRSRLAQDQVRHQNRVEKILEDALLKISVVISDLLGASGGRFLDALVAGERSPKTLAALGDRRLRASTTELRAALTGRFREVHDFEIATHLRLIAIRGPSSGRPQCGFDPGVGEVLALVEALGVHP
jgi:transposase